MRVIRVCFVAPKAYPLFNPVAKGIVGGAEVDMYHLTTELAKDERFSVHCVVADYGQQFEEKWEQVNVVKGVYFDNHPLRAVFRLWGAMKRIDADIYFVKTASPGLPVIAGFCRRYRRYFIYRTAHSDECDGTWNKKHPFWARGFVWALRRACLIFAQTRRDADNLQRTMGLSSIVLPNGHRIGPLPQEQRDTILWVGRTADFKHPERFLDLAEQFPDEHFTFICQRATRDAGYDALIDRVGGMSNLTHVPHVPFPEMDSYFLRAKCYVNTSDAEGFPNTFIQAARCGCPILSFKVDPDGFFETHQCGLCAEGDRGRLKEMLRAILKAGTAAPFSQNALYYVSQNHNIHMVAEDYKKYFQELCGLQTAIHRDNP